MTLTTYRIWGIALIATGATHCGGQVAREQKNDVVGGTFAGQMPGSTGSGGAAEGMMPASDASSAGPGVGAVTGCMAKPGPLHPLPTLGDFIALFSRQWSSCGDPTITHDSKDAGFAASVDGSYQMLSRAADGSLQPNGRGGTYKVIPNAPNVWQVDFAGAASALKVATTTDSPRLLSMNEIGVFNYRYIPLDTTGWTEVGPAQTSRGKYVPPATCSSGTTASMRTIQTEGEFKALVSRRWALCSADGIGEKDPSRSGLEIRPDGRFSVLFVDASNQTVAATDALNAGTWEVYPNAPSVYQITFHRGDGLMRIAITSLTTGPEAMLMDNSGFDKYRYIPLD